MGEVYYVTDGLLIASGSEEDVGERLKKKVSSFPIIVGLWRLDSMHVPTCLDQLEINGFLPFRPRAIFFPQSLH